MRCYHCGQDIPDGSQFCPNCGSGIGMGCTTVLDASCNPFTQPLSREEMKNISRYESSQRGIFGWNQRPGRESCTYGNEQPPSYYERAQSYAPPVQPEYYEQYGYVYPGQSGYYGAPQDYGHGASQPFYGQQEFSGYAAQQNPYGIAQQQYEVQVPADSYYPYGYPGTQPEPAYYPNRPMHLPTDRSILKVILLGIVTFGIYDIILSYHMVNELNMTASRYDGRWTPGYFAMWILSILTGGIYWFVWNHQYCRRLEEELRWRNCSSELTVRDFWLWNVLGMIFIAGPFIFKYKLLKARNELNNSYNYYG